MADEKASSGRDVPQLNWRYILFTWNDNDEEMTLMRKLAAEVGADRLCWEITDHPEDSFSRRFAAGSPELDRSATRFGMTTISATQSRVRHLGPRSTSSTGFRGRRCGGAARPLAVRTRVKNLSTRPFRAQASHGVAWFDWGHSCSTIGVRS